MTAWSFDYGAPVAHNPNGPTGPDDNQPMTYLMDYLSEALPLLFTLAGVALVLKLAHRFLLARHPNMGNERKFPRQMVMLGLTVTGAIAVASALPVSESTRNQVIGLLGILVSGAFAFSSTTVLSNLMAGMVLRMTQSFQTGDFVRVGEYFGRVAERGVFDVEIQTEQRELVSVSNSFLMANPITVVRSSGAIVSSTFSLGYDVHHAKVEPLLLQAATEMGLEEPFTQVLELGNYAITYRVSGLLLDVDHLITARSRLNRQVLDVLHGAGIEIMSPLFLNQRPVPVGREMVPERMRRSVPPSNELLAEQVVFDKAEEAGQRAKAHRDLKAQQHQLESQIEVADHAHIASLAAALAQVKAQIANLEIEPPPG